MTGRYLVLTKEYARAKTQAVTPEPHEKTGLLLWFCKIFWNNWFKFSTLLNEWSSFMISAKGRQKELGIEPLLTFFLGSGTFPSNLSLLRASITVNSFLEIFLSICFLFLTSLLNSFPL